MLDELLLFHDGATLTTSGTTSWLDVAKTPAAGVVVEVAVTSIAGSTTGRTMDFIVQESATNDETAPLDVVTFPQMTTTGRYTKTVQSSKRYLRLKRTFGTGTGLSAVVTAGMVSGHLNDQT